MAVHVSSGSLRDMMIIAQCVDIGIDEVEKALMSVDNLMPVEAKKTEALEIANSMFQEIREIEETVQKYNIQMKALLEETILGNEKADSEILSLEEGITHIEETLKKYGYDNSTMPSETPVDADESLGSSESVPDMTEDNKCAMPSPPLKQNMAFESLAGVEITPFILSSKSYRSQSSGTGSPKLTQCSRNLDTSTKNLAPESAYYSGSDQCVSPTPNKQPYQEERQSSAKPNTVLVKPQRPVLSKTTYELLGENPPMEHFVRDEDN